MASSTTLHSNLKCYSEKFLIMVHGNALCDVTLKLCAGWDLFVTPQHFVTHCEIVRGRMAFLLCIMQT